MHIVDVDQNTEAWFEERRGKISGTRLGEVYSSRAYTKADLIDALEKADIEFDKKMTVKDLDKLVTNDVKLELLRLAPKKIGFYEILAERLASEPDDEDRRDRGHRLEEDVVELFTEMTGKKVERVGICVSSFNPDVINSPDGLIATEIEINGEKAIVYKEAIEIKCLSTARHLQAVIENRIPDEFTAQKLQYFIVNDQLEQLHFVFHDDRIVHKDLQTKIVTVNRSDLEEQIELYKAFQTVTLEEIDKLISQYGF